LVSWSRIYLSYHTPKQVLVGVAAGGFSAVSWFLLTTIVRQIGLLNWILDQYPTRLFRMRDLVVEEDLCQAGWEKWESKKISKHTNGKKNRWYEYIGCLVGRYRLEELSRIRSKPEKFPCPARFRAREMLRVRTSPSSLGLDGMRGCLCSPKAYLACSKVV